VTGRGDEPSEEPELTVRATIRLVGGDTGRALAAAQGRALRDLLALLADIEVGPAQRDGPQPKG
jgi:hypothetical protein